MYLDLFHILVYILPTPSSPMFIVYSHNVVCIVEDTKSLINRGVLDNFNVKVEMVISLVHSASKRVCKEKVRKKCLLDIPSGDMPLTACSYLHLFS